MATPLPKFYQHGWRGLDMAPNPDAAPDDRSPKNAASYQVEGGPHDAAPPPRRVLGLGVNALTWRAVNGLCRRVDSCKHAAPDHKRTVHRTARHDAQLQNTVTQDTLKTYVPKSITRVSIRQ